MVALSGDGWRLAPSLVALVNETDRLWPNRNRVSDGSIGDTAHKASVSDHNPAGGWVTAVDITEDPVNGPDLPAFWDHVVKSRDPRVKYLIYEGRIVASYPVSGVPAWVPRVYSGANPHDRHLHVSVNSTGTGLTDTSAWYGQKEEDMPLNDADLDRIAKTVRGVLDEGQVFGNKGWAETNRSILTVGQATFNNTNLIRAALGGLTADDIAARIVAKLPADGIDQATVEAGVRAVLADALDGE